jgi:phosphomannomutase/phosphoglucomutase
MTSFFRAYDLRGVYPDDIGTGDAERVGNAYGTATETESVLVGRDGRTHAETVRDAFVRGVTATGTDVIDIGEVPTPAVRFGCWRRDVDGGVMITASHNPAEYTGFKFSKADGRAMTRSGGMAEIQRVYESGAFEEGDGRWTELDLDDEYVEYVRQRAESVRADSTAGVNLKIVANFSNGVAGPLGRRVLESLGCHVVGVNEVVDGSFPDHHPTPTDPAAIDRVQARMSGADLGVAFDGDADRVGIVLPGVGKISPDKLLALFATVCLAEEAGTVVYSLDASQLVPETVRDHGGDPREVRVGSTYISQLIFDEPDVVFAGEPSGHYSFPAFGVPWDDGIFTAALVARLVAATDVAARIAGFPEYPVSPTLRLDCPEPLKEPVVKGVVDAYSEHEQTTVDGVKLFFSDGWALVRPSNTEPKLSVRCEADTEPALTRIQADVRDTVEELIENAGAR